MPLGVEQGHFVSLRARQCQGGSVGREGREGLEGPEGQESQESQESRESRESLEGGLTDSNRTTRRLL